MEYVLWIKRKDSLLAENNSLNIFNGVFIPDYLLVKNMVNVSSFTIPSALRYSSTDLHEKIHWFQHAATTWGNFCLILNQSVVESFNNTAYYSNINKIIEDYHKIQLDQDLYPETDQNFCQESLIFKKNVIDKFVAREFVNYGTQNSVLDRCLDGLTFSRSDVYTEINYLRNKYFECNLKELDLRYQFGKCNIYSIKGEVLQVKNLLECQARTSDTYYKLVNLQYGLDVSDLQILNNELYWMAFRHYVFFSDLDMDYVVKKRLHIEIPKFNAIVDISLNPPIFPFCEELFLSWDDYYPIQRFKKLCLCNKEFKDFKIADDISYSNYESLLCKMLDWQTPIEISRLYVDKVDSRIVEFCNCWESKLDTISTYTLYDYFQYLFYKFCKLRIDFPSLLSNYGFNSTNRESIVNVAELEVGSNNYWYSCPMKMNDGNENLLTGIKDAQYSWLLIELLKSNIIRENILSNKPLSNKSFPFIVKPGFRDYVIESFNKLYNINLSEIWM